MSKPISIRISDELDSKLSEIASETERSKSFHVKKALEAYLAELADFHVALDRLHNTSDPIKSVSRDLRKIDKEQADRILKKIEEDLPEKADNFPSQAGKLAGLKEFRVGDYRAIYTIIEDTALILRNGHQRESYR